jgi:hypothetical protein
MNIGILIIQIFALVCLIFAAFNLFTAQPNKPVWGWLGMALWLFSLMVGSFSIHATISGH